MIFINYIYHIIIVMYHIIDSYWYDYTYTVLVLLSLLTSIPIPILSSIYY